MLMARISRTASTYWAMPKATRLASCMAWTTVAWRLATSPPAKTPLRVVSYVFSYFFMLRNSQSSCQRLVASLVQCSLTGVMRLSLGQVSRFHTA